MDMANAFTEMRGTVRTTVRLNLRQAPNTTAAVKGTVDPNMTLTVFAKGQGQNVSGNDTWYQADSGLYFWSGGCGPLMVSPPPPDIVTASADLRVNRRADGTILPLGEQQLRATFGAFPYTEGTGGRIVVAPAWVQANIVTVENPVMAGLGFPKLQLHVKAKAPFERVMASLVTAGLTSGLLTCAGSYVTRHKGWNPARGLSPHSWGIAIDVNAEWNGYGQTPAALGAHGSCRQFVPYFEAEGFAWGGYFSSPFEDGMHFELARFDL